MLRLVDVHNEIYEYLIERRKIDSKLRFTFRKSNHSNRLEEGYWFYGNQHYLAISFWTGMDWQNRTPNIIFIIDEREECFLEVNVSDSELKRQFVEQELIDKLLLKKSKRRYYKKYSDSRRSFLSVLDEFLENDKKVIDDILDKGFYYLSGYKESQNNLIDFIDAKEFNKRHDKIKKYIALREKFKDEDDDFGINEDKPGKLFGIKIENHNPIKNIVLEIGKKKNQWIFFTGANGSGKTMILKSLAIFLGNKLIPKNKISGKPPFSIIGELLYKNELSIYNRFNNEVKLNDQEIPTRSALVQGLAMYGPYRLDIVNDKIGPSLFREKLTKKSSFNSLFDTGQQLLSLNRQFELWQTGSNRQRNLFKKRKYYITSVLTAIIPNLIDVRFKIENKKRITEYLFNNDNDEEYSVSWEELSSGTKNIIALIGDILIRLYNHQKNVIDPSEFRGIVIIDEIDLHLHPQAQKDLVVNLTKTFSNIQFIVSTHSPIPLLGAPKESVIFVVKNEIDTGISVKRIKNQLEIQDMLPNSILSSPIFEFNDLIPISHNKEKKIRTEDTFEEIKKNDELKLYLKSIAKKMEDNK